MHKTNNIKNDIENDVENDVENKVENNVENNIKKYKDIDKCIYRYIWYEFNSYMIILYLF